MNYKCSFPSHWLGLEGEELITATGIASAGFCHKGGFLMTVGTLKDAVAVCAYSLATFHEAPVLVSLGGNDETDALLHQLPKLQKASIISVDFPAFPELEVQGIYGEVALEKSDWKALMKDSVKQILYHKPEAVFVRGDVFASYPIIHALRKKHVPILTLVEKDGKKLIVRIPSGS